MKNLYETDFYRWAQMQTDHLRNQRYHLLDLDHLIEEIEDLGDSQRDEIYSHMVSIITHLLKLKYSNGKDLSYNYNVWNNTVDISRSHLKLMLKKHPALRNYFLSQIVDAFETAMQDALTLEYLSIDKEENSLEWTKEIILGQKWIY